MSLHLSNERRLPFRVDGRISAGRAPLEFYPTPPPATRALLSAERFDGSIWEPACGKGAISDVLSDAGNDVVSTDIGDYGFGDSGVDFLSETKPRARNIVTNPPYGRGLADRFIRHGLAMIAQTGGSMAMLLNLAGLCHPDRHESYLRRPPRVIYALDHCVCWPGGEPTQATRFTKQHRYCWLVWDALEAAETKFAWLSTAPFENGGALWS